MKEFIEEKKKELSLRLYAYYGKVEEDTGDDAKEFEENCLDWLEKTINEAMLANPVENRVMPKIAEEYKLLKQIAYCSSGMFDAESEQNFGDAKEWKFQLKQQIDIYKEKEYDSQKDL